MTLVTVRITSCTEPKSWYLNKIGQTYLCYKGDNPDIYVLDKSCYADPEAKRMCDNFISADNCIEVSLKIKKIPQDETHWQYEFMCPGCNDTHTLNNTWEFNNDYEFPSLSPSILTQGHMKDENAEYGSSPFRCHSWITKGKIKFFEDCSHDKAGQKWFDLLEI